MKKKLTIEEQEKLINKIDASLKNTRERLQNYRVLIQDVIVWDSKQFYLDLLKDFLTNKIDGGTFCSKFLEIRYKNLFRISEICNKIEEDIMPIPNFLYTSESGNFAAALDDLFFEVERYDPDIDDSDWNEVGCSENQLRSIIQETYAPILQQSCNLDSEFFQSNIDLD